MALEYRDCDAPCVSNSYPARERERDPFRAPPALTRRAPAKPPGVTNPTHICAYPAHPRLPRKVRFLVSNYNSAFQVMYYDFWFDIEHAYEPTQLDAFGNQYAVYVSFDACRVDGSTNVLAGPKDPPIHYVYSDDEIPF